MGFLGKCSGNKELRHMVIRPLRRIDGLFLVCNAFNARLRERKDRGFDASCIHVFQPELILLKLVFYICEIHTVSEVVAPCRLEVRRFNVFFKCAILPVMVFSSKRCGVVKNGYPNLPS